MMEQRKPGPGQPMGVLDWRRTVAALGRQVDDPDALAQAYTVLDAMESALIEAAQRLMVEGYSYADLARPFGISRQGARKRWPRTPVGEGEAESSVEPEAAQDAEIENLIRVMRDCDRCELFVGSQAAPCPEHAPIAAQVRARLPMAQR